MADGVDPLAADLLAHLRKHLDRPRLHFAESPAILRGGFDTRIFAFRLGDAPPAFSAPLVLRVVARGADPLRVRREGAVQNAVAALGYPAPRVVHVCTDVAILGGAFLVMERAPGRVLPQERLLGMSAVLVDLQRQLHALDAEPLLRTLDEQTPHGRSAVTLDGHLAEMSRRARAPGLEGLRSIAGWLGAHRPSENARPVICHGDFHPLNVLYESGRVTAVLDWPNAIVAEPAYDVAATRTILATAPIDLAGVSPAMQWLARAGRRMLLRRYLSGYRRRVPLDEGRLAYYDVLACMRALVRIAETRARGGPGDVERARLETPAYADALLRRVGAVTGMTARLPSSSGSG